MRTLPLVLLGLFGAKCGVSNEINPIDDDDEKDLAPELVLSPDYIDFGELRPGETSSTTVAIRNEGNVALNLSEVRLEGESGFTLDSAALVMTLEPGQETTVTLSFSPQTIEHEAALAVYSDDPDASRSLVELEGYGLIPQLFVSPNPYDFGRVEPLCAREGLITMTNTGRDTLVVDGIAQLGQGFVLDEEGLELPVSLEPNESRDLKVTFTPEALAEYDGELWFSSNGGDPVVQQSGEGAEVGEYVEEWTQPKSKQVDIMFFIDKSCSMEDDKERLANNFTQFTDHLRELDADYLVMVATQDGGCHNGDMIDKDTPKDLISGQFRQAIDQPGGVYTEAGLMIARNAVNNSDAGECNDGFLREGSMVSFILIADEPEQSPGGTPWDEQVTAIQARAPSAYISAVAGPVPDGCDTAEAGYGYYEASVATGGLFRSVCDTNWGEHLSKLADLAVSVVLPDTFLLEDEPMVDTLRVFVDGEEVTVGWTYDAEQNAIVFAAEAVPEEGTTIQARYASGISCD